MKPQSNCKTTKPQITLNAALANSQPQVKNNAQHYIIYLLNNHFHE